MTGFSYIVYGNSVCYKETFIKEKFVL